MDNGDGRRGVLAAGKPLQPSTALAFFTVEFELFGRQLKAHQDLVIDPPQARADRDDLLDLFDRRRLALIGLEGKGRFEAFAGKDVLLLIDHRDKEYEAGLADLTSGEIERRGEVVDLQDAAAFGAVAREAASGTL